MKIKLLGYVSAFILVGLVSYGGWIVTKWWNYAWGYESQVRSTICEMVKEESLNASCEDQ